LCLFGLFREIICLPLNCHLWTFWELNTKWFGDLSQQKKFIKKSIYSANFSFFDLKFDQCTPDFAQSTLNMKIFLNWFYSYFFFNYGFVMLFTVSKNSKNIDKVINSKNKNSKITNLIQFFLMKFELIWLI